LTRRSLGVVGPEAEGIGVPTIMDRALAARHREKYVHLAVFAIDVDRVRDEMETEALDGDWPFAWEVFLTERWLLDHVDPARDADRELVEDTCESVMQSSLAHEGQVFGAQIPFAVWDAIARGVWPSALKGVFDSWRHRPDRLVRTLARFWKSPDEEARRLADRCLAVELDPPLAPPTLETLRELAGDRRREGP
jgi:hypothetical protein